MNAPKPCDVLVMGCGLAGMVTALSLPTQWRVSVLSKDRADACATAWAQGGIAAVLDKSDSVAAHVQDTLIAGAGQCDAAVVQAVLAAAPAAITWLRQHGVRFDEDNTGALHLTREGGHSARRIAHVADHTGAAVHAALLHACRARSNIDILEMHTALDLCLQADERGQRHCTGAWVQGPDGQLQAWQARHTVLATGGLGQLFAQTTNPASATGDGLAMAWRAGCAVRDLEFIQFHPTALQVQGQSVGLITEALRGEGARLCLPNGEAFMARHDARAELAPRDIVARAIWHEMRAHQLSHVCLDMRHRPRAWLAQHFPAVMQLCARHGIDMANQLIPVAPCAHYACGGVEAGIDGRTSLAGLYAVGEVARTGLHGANRLASNSLLECVVMGRAAAQAMTQCAQDAWLGAGMAAGEAQAPALDTEVTDARRASMRQLMLDSAGILRRPQDLQQAAAQLEQWRSTSQTQAQALRNQLDAAWLVVQAAMQRTHSCGAHALASD